MTRREILVALARRRVLCWNSVDLLMMAFMILLGPFSWPAIIALCVAGAAVSVTLEEAAEWESEQ